MRHGKKFNHLGRKSAHRKAMLSNMAAALILNKRIKTTTAKAKALKVYIEPLITKSKDDSTHNRRVVFSYLQNKYAVAELFREVSEKVGERPGGYTRILKTGTRLGDNADMCFIELVDFNDVYTQQKQEATKSKRSRRGGKKKADATETAPEAKTEVAEEAAVVEEPKTDAEANVEVAAEPEASTEETKEESSEDNAEGDDAKN